MLVSLVGAALARAADVEGSLAGRVLDATSGEPVAGASVVVTWPAPADGSAQRKEARVTGADGSWEVTGVSGGTYGVRIDAPGFKPASLKGLVVRPGESNRADLSLSPAAETGEAPPDVEEFVVVGTKAEAIEASRADSDQLLDTLSAEEFSKFAASDVADALKFVPGVNVVKGQFAIIRGLEDRYSSTLYNGAPVPSPDPNRQSVPLDLFPSEVVTNLVVAKTFAPELPSNSSGGSIDIITHDYPEALEIKATAGVSLNSNARKDFISFDGGSSVGRGESGARNALGDEFGVSLAGRGTQNEREVRYKLVLDSEVDYHTATGFQEGREPSQRIRFGTQKSGDLALGKLSLSDGRFDLTGSDEERQQLGYGGFGLDLDQQGNHKIDVSAFYVKKQDRAVELKQDGFLPGYDYSQLAAKQANGDDIVKNSDFDGFATPSAWIALTVRPQPNMQLTNGPMWSSSFSTSTSFDRDRDLLVTQIDGDHTIEALEGLHVRWAGNYAKTTQDEQSLGSRIFFEPTDPNVIPARIPPSVESLGPGQFADPNSGILFSGANVDEHQYFGRLDADYQADLADRIALKLSAGAWYENAQRGARASFLQNPQIVSSQCAPHCQGGGTNFVFLGDTPNLLGHFVFDGLRRDPSGDYTSVRNTTSDSSREISAGYLGSKTTLWDDVDLLGGLRLERILIESNNDPFIGEISPINGAPTIFPTSFLMFERLDNPALGEVGSPPPPGTVFNDQILGLKVPVNASTGTVDLLTRQAIEALVDGRIDQTRLLPSAGFAYRPLDGLALRGAFSRTVARPSFREISYYVSVEPGSDDLIVGNPQLKLSDVESYDLRAEYAWGDVGDLFALSAFYKRIDDPIESIVIRDPVNKDGTNSALYRTFFNNPNVARLWGLEAEGRKNLGFLGVDAARYFSVGANATYIDAKVARTQAELARSTLYFGVAPGDTGLYSGMKPTRRLFGQPQWIANADLTFDQPDWGTKATLALFAISDVLDAAGAANLNANNQVYSFTLDRYVDSFSRLDLIVSQTVHADFLGSDLVFKISAKNLTDTTRRVIYDPGQTAVRIPERSYKLGRDFKLTVTWAF